MPHRPLRACVLRALTGTVLTASVLSGCGRGGAEVPAAPVPEPAVPDPAADPTPPADAEPGAAPRSVVPDGPHEIVLVADFGPLPDGSGDAVVETTWTVDARGVGRLVVDTPAGPAVQHVMTETEHWWWLSPEVRSTIADAEWVYFDLAAIDEAGGVLPEVVAEARAPVPQPGEIEVGQIVGGREVRSIEVVDDDEVHLTVAGVERPVVHRRRRLPPGTLLEVPSGAVDVRDLPGVLRW